MVFAESQASPPYPCAEPNAGFVRNRAARDAFATLMYRPTLKPRDRLASLLLVGAIHAALIVAMLNLSGAIDIVSRDDLTQLVDIVDPPPPPVEEVPVELEPAAKEEGEAAPPNIESRATAIPDPEPPIVLPVPVPVPVSPTPNVGSERTQGAAPVPGPGTGAGGIGTGTGAGGAGSGTGGGGTGPIAMVRTRLATRPLTGRDFPPDLLDRWPPGQQILLRFRVDANGTIIQCDVFQGSGDPSVDQQVCAIARQRLRYRPGLDANRQRVADWAAYGQRPPR